MSSKSEASLSEVFDRLDGLLQRLVAGDLGPGDFLNAYRYPASEHALDGHEAGPTELTTLQRYKARLKVHEVIADRVLNRVYKGPETDDPKYQAAGRIGPDKACQLIIEIALAHGFKPCSDWRLNGQERYLRAKTFKFKTYTPYREDWAHDHCAFCWVKIEPYPAIAPSIDTGYSTDEDYYWVCSKCYQDFQESFDWKCED